MALDVLVDQVNLVGGADQTDSYRLSRDGAVEVVLQNKGPILCAIASDSILTLGRAVEANWRRTDPRERQHPAPSRPQTGLVGADRVNVDA